MFSLSTMTLQNIFCRAAIQPNSSQPLLSHEVIPPQVQDSVFAFVGFHDCLISPDFESL